MNAGLVTEVPSNFRVYILEYMAHLSLQDWKAVGDDFVNLQFVAPGSMHPNDIPGLMDAVGGCLLYTSPSPRDRTRSRMPSSA